MTAKNYSYTWTCKACKTSNTFMRSKHDAAFNIIPRKLPCRSCGRTEAASVSWDMPEVDLELLEAWYKNTNLSFLDQDEDLIIAGAEVPVFKAFFATDEHPPARQKDLGSILAIKLYDETFESPADRQWCIDWLQLNPKFWRGSTAGYILKKIKPILDA